MGDQVSESTDRAELVTRPRFFLDNQTSLAAPCPMNQGRQQRAGIPLLKKQKGVAALDQTDQIPLAVHLQLGWENPFAPLLKTTEDEEEKEVFIRRGIRSAWSSLPLTLEASGGKSSALAIGLLRLRVIHSGPTF